MPLWRVVINPLLGANFDPASLYRLRDCQAVEKERWAIGVDRGPGEARRIFQGERKFLRGSRDPWVDFVG